MFEELRPDQYDRVKPLYEDMTHSLAVHAVLDGYSPGHIFVDSAARPRAALALTIEGYLLAGDHEDAGIRDSLRRLLAARIFTGEVFVGSDSRMVLAVTPDDWTSKLPELIPTHEADPLPRTLYLCRDVALDWRAALPDGYHVRRLDRALLDDPAITFSEAVESWVPTGAGWGGTDRFLREGVCFVVVHENQVVSRCMADCKAGERIDVGIITDPAHRRKGLAACVTAATVEYCLDHGFREVGWHCEDDNVGSWKTAERAGFRRAEAYTYYYYIYELADQLSQLAWSCYKRGEYKKTADYYEQVFARRAENPDYYYHLAALAWGALGKGAMSLRYLNRAADQGWPHAAYSAGHDHLRILRGLPAFETVLARMRQNALQE